MCCGLIVVKLHMCCCRLHVNAFGRVILTNAGTPIEALLTTGEYGMRLDSYIYDKIWSFDKSNFETDLIHR